MAAKYRKKLLAVFEHGTRIHSPSAGEPRYRVVATDPTTGQRVTKKARTEADARQAAHQLEERLATAKPLRRDPAEAARTVELLAERYVADHLATLSLRYRERQEYPLAPWILPRLGHLPLEDWTPAESIAVLTAVRTAGRSPALVQDIGATMRGLITHARRLRWFGPTSDDPMWMVTYSRKATVQGAGVGFIRRSNLPTDEQCNALFAAMTALGEPTWALAMRLKHRSGVRWGELTALRAGDIGFDPRTVKVVRSVEQGRRSAPGLKDTKNHLERTSIFPRSLEHDVRAHLDDVVGPMARTGSCSPPGEEA